MDTPWTPGDLVKLKDDTCRLFVAPDGSSLCVPVPPPLSLESYTEIEGDVMIVFDICDDPASNLFIVAGYQKNKRHIIQTRIHAKHLVFVATGR